MLAWRRFSQFLCYKTLKKCLKSIPEPKGAAKNDKPESLAPAVIGAERRSPNEKKELVALTAEQRAFVKTLNDELKKFNKFFMNAEEDLVMRERVLGTRFHKLVDKDTGKLATTRASVSETEARDELSATTVSELKDTRKAFADFHGELVLLEHWTSLNYTALVKILKKHDKRSSLRLRSPFLVSALQQPFCSTEVLTQLIKKTEARFRKLHDLTSEVEAAERERNGGEANASPSRPAKTPAAVARTRAAISCWDGMKDEDSVKRPFGDFMRSLSTTTQTPEPSSKRRAGVA